MIPVKPCSSQLYDKDGKIKAITIKLLKSFFIKNSLMILEALRNILNNNRSTIFIDENFKKNFHKMTRKT
tara:strand:- start:13606 stop:13815 length:210 start_codon:yes stop_codon:yes gene_type:complete